MDSLLDLPFSEIERLILSVRRIHGVSIEIPEYLRFIVDDHLYDTQSIRMIFPNPRSGDGYIHEKTVRRWFREGLQGVGILPKCHPRNFITTGRDLKEFLWRRDKVVYLNRTIIRKDKSAMDYLYDVYKAEAKD